MSNISTEEQSDFWLNVLKLHWFTLMRQLFHTACINNNLILKLWCKSFSVVFCCSSCRTDPFSTGCCRSSAACRSGEWAGGRRDYSIVAISTHFQISHYIKLKSWNYQNNGLKMCSLILFQRLIRYLIMSGDSAGKIQEDSSRFVVVQRQQLIRLDDVV